MGHDVMIELTYDQENIDAPLGGMVIEGFIDFFYGTWQGEVYWCELSGTVGLDFFHDQMQGPLFIIDVPTHYTFRNIMMVIDNITMGERDYADGIIVDNTKLVELLSSGIKVILSRKTKTTMIWADTPENKLKLDMML